MLDEWTRPMWMVMYQWRWRSFAQPLNRISARLWAALPRLDSLPGRRGTQYLPLRNDLLPFSFLQIDQLLWRWGRSESSHTPSLRTSSCECHHAQVRVRKRARGRKSQLAILSKRSCGLTRSARLFELEMVTEGTGWPRQTWLTTPRKRADDVSNEILNGFPQTSLLVYWLQSTSKWVKFYGDFHLLNVLLAPSQSFSRYSWRPSKSVRKEHEEHSFGLKQVYCTSQLIKSNRLLPFPFRLAADDQWLLCIRQNGKCSSVSGLPRQYGASWSITLYDFILLLTTNICCAFQFLHGLHRSLAVFCIALYFMWPVGIEWNERTLCGKRYHRNHQQVSN